MAIYVPRPKNAAPKAWNGGQPPELGQAGERLVEHMESCEHCKRFPLNPCDTGLELHTQFEATFRKE